MTKRSLAGYDQPTFEAREQHVTHSSSRSGTTRHAGRGAINRTALAHGLPACLNSGPIMRSFNTMSGDPFDEVALPDYEDNERRDHEKHTRRHKRAPGDAVFGEEVVQSDGQRVLARAVQVDQRVQEVRPGPDELEHCSRCQ